MNFRKVKIGEINNGIDGKEVYYKVTPVLKWFDDVEMADTIKEALYFPSRSPNGGEFCDYVAVTRIPHSDELMAIQYIRYDC